MEETQTILDNATVDSLVIVDELGRGTSTYDGLSIAYSVLKYLMEKIKVFFNIFYQNKIYIFLLI